MRPLGWIYTSCFCLLYQIEWAANVQECTKNGYAAFFSNVVQHNTTYGSGVLKCMYVGAALPQCFGVSFRMKNSEMCYYTVHNVLSIMHAFSATHAIANVCFSP